MSIGGIDVTFAQMRDRSCAAANVLLDLGVDRVMRRPVRRHVSGVGVLLARRRTHRGGHRRGECRQQGRVPATRAAAGAGEARLHRCRAPPPRAEVADDVETLDAFWYWMIRSASAPTSSTNTPASPDDVAVVVLHVGYYRAVQGRCHHLALPVQRGRCRRDGLGVRFRRGVVDRDAALSPQRGAHRAGADAGRRNDGVGDRVSPGEVWDDVRDCGAVGFAGAGAMVSMLWNQPPDPRDAELPLRFISAAPIAADLYRDIETRYGCRVVTMYGLTEAFPVAYKAVSDAGVPGTSGRSIPTSRCASSTRTASRCRR